MRTTSPLPPYVPPNLRLADSSIPPAAKLPPKSVFFEELLCNLLEALAASWISTVTVSPTVRALSSAATADQVVPVKSCSA